MSSIVLNPWNTISKLESDWALKGLVEANMTF